MSSLFFREEGSGPPLVFLHGFCETHEIWEGFTAPFTGEMHVLTPDLPGFGKSETLHAPFSIDQVGDAVASWLAENKISQPIVIGHSLGGYVALSLAAHHPQLLKGFGLFHSHSFADTEEKKENRNKVIQFVRKNGVQPFIDTFVPGLFFDKSCPLIPIVERIAAQTKLETLIGYSHAMRDRPDQSHVMRNNEIPKLLIAGEEDATIPIQTSREMAKISKNSSFHELKNVAHMGFFEAKTACQTIIKGFAYRLLSNK